MKKLNKKGFTIVELVIVIAVIAILAGVLIPTFAGVITKAEESNALQEAKNTYTEDLIALDGQAANAAKAEYKKYVKTTDTAVAQKTYYTMAVVEGVETYTAVAAPVVENIATYYELTSICVGEFSAVDANGDYTYTVKVGEYNAKYTSADGAWVINK